MPNLTKKEQQSRRQYFKKFCPVTILLMVLIFFQGFFDARPDSIWKILVTLGMAVPILSMVTLDVRYVQRRDEYMRKMYMVSAVYTLILTTGAAYLYGLLEEAVGFPHLNLSIAAMAVYMIYMFIGSILVSRG